MWPKVNFKYVESDAIICTNAAYFHGLIMDASTDGGDVTIYEGQDAKSGRKLAKFQDWASSNRPFNMPHCVYCQRGIFVDIGDNVTGVTVIWSRPEQEAVAV